MREAHRFLEALSDILDAVVTHGVDLDDIGLLLEAARKDVETVRLADPSAEYEISQGDVFWRGRPLAGTVEWPWRTRLLDADLLRLAPPDDAAAFRAWVEMVRDQLTDPPGPETVAPPPAATSGAETPAANPQVSDAVPEQAATGEVAAPPARGATGSRTSREPVDREWAPPANAFSLEEETERAWWLHGEAANAGRVPRRESEELVERLARVLARGPATARGRSLEVFDELTTVHVVNVALLAMGLGKHLAFDDDQVRTLGLAGLYHDVGRVRLDERDHGSDPASEARRKVLATHPEAGARVLMDSGTWFAAAAVVSYEHHLTWRGTGGYPGLHFARAPHQFSRIVSVCDTYDALRTERAHRAALSHEAATEYLRILAGKTLDPEIVTGFAGYVSEPITCLVHPRTRPEAQLAEFRWLPDTGFDPDFEPRPVSI